MVADPVGAEAPELAGPDPGVRSNTAIQLRNWLEEWGGTAKKVINRRDYLISLGLVKRRKTKATVEEPETDDALVVTELVTDDTLPLVPAPSSNAPA